ncbi:MAG: hypothetical protein COB04_13040 [Gammaproteobacteria bacterium]|nr:MAG: hypothetical protein COB04_13040 [Gammaproteobacteria bacterium]
MNLEILSIVLLASLCLFLGGYVAARIFRNLFSIYRENFLESVDRGLQDILLYMNPKQLFVIQMSIMVLIMPIIFFTFNAYVMIGVVVAILALPRFLLPMMKNHRNNLLIAQLPDTLSSLGSSLRSGLNLVQALQQIVKNQPQPISQEFAQVLIEYRMGKDLNDSLDSFADRTGREEFVILNSSIKIARAVGGNLSTTLDALSETLREKAKLEGKVNALTSMGRAQGWVATILPVFMGYAMYRMEPSAMGKLFTTLGGWIWLSIAITLIVMATITIRKMVNINV